MLLRIREGYIFLLSGRINSLLYTVSSACSIIVYCLTSRNGKQSTESYEEFIGKYRQNWNKIIIFCNYRQKYKSTVSNSVRSSADEEILYYRKQAFR